MTELESIKKELERSKRAQKRFKICVLSFLCVFLIISFAYVYAKNTRSEKDITELHSKEFYFSVYAFGDPELVDLSSYYSAFEINPEETIEVFGSLEKEEQFSVRNYLNNINVDRITGYDIEYKVEAKWLNEEISAPLTLVKNDVSTSGNQTLTGNIAQEDNWKLTIPAKGELAHYDNEKIIVTIQSLSPYKQTYKLIYELHVNNPIEKYWVSDKGEYYELKIATYKGYNKLEVFWPEDLLIDESNPYTYTYTTEDGVNHYTSNEINEITTSPYSDAVKGYRMVLSKPLEETSSISINFYKRDGYSTHASYLVNEINQTLPTNTRIYVREVNE